MRTRNVRVDVTMLPEGIQRWQVKLTDSFRNLELGMSVLSRDNVYGTCSSPGFLARQDNDKSRASVQKLA